MWLFSDPLRFKQFHLTPSFHCKRKDKASQSSSGCPMQEAKNPQLEMAKQPQIKCRIQASMSLFHFISLAERSGHCNRHQAAVCFPKSKTKRCQRGGVHFHHDTRPSKTRLVTLPPLQTKPHLGTTPSLVIDNFSFEPRVPSGRFDERALSQSPNQIHAGNVYKFDTQRKTIAS